MSNTRDRPSRLQDVALRAGVSPITVSRVLRTPDKVSVQTRTRVEAAIAAVNYIPNAIARSLASNRTRLVVAIFPNLQNPLFTDTISGLNQTLTEHGLSLVIASVGRAAGAEEALIASMLMHRPCAIFLHHSIHTERTRRMLRDPGLIVVEGGDLAAHPIDSVVSYSHREAAHSLTAVLLAKGRRKLVFVGTAESNRHAAHYAGYQRALEAVGQRASGASVRVPHSYEAGRKVLRELIEADPALDGVVFASATSAAGALLQCSRTGLAVPHRLSIVSLDDSELAPNLDPPLTAVQVSRFELGQRAAEIIVARLAGRAAPRRVQLAFSLVLRGSH